MIQNQIKEQSLKVKMCGMRRKEDIAYANEVKPDAIGYIFFSKSKRYVTGQQARELESDGTYVRVKNEKAPLNSQEYFYAEAYEQNLPKERS